MKFVLLFTLVSSALAVPVHHAPIATDKVLVNTGASAQYRSQDNLGNYAFGYNEEHATGGSFRRETGNSAGQVVGSYGLRAADGRVRIVNYVADDDGFRADINTNEPGVEPRDPAAVTINKAGTVAVAPVAVAPAAQVVASPIVQERVLAAPVAPVIAAGKTVIAPAPVQQVVEPVVQYREEPIVQQRYVPPVAPIVQEKVVAPVVQHYEPQIVEQAPIVQQKVVQQVYERPIVQERYVAPIVQERLEPIVQQHVEPAIIRQEKIIEEPIVQQHVEPVVQQYLPPVAPVAPIVQQKVAPIYTSQYFEPALRPVAAPLLGGVKGGAPIVARSPFASPAKLIKGNAVPVVIGQNEDTALELVDTYAHPASFGYSLGMPSTWGYTYVVRRKK